MVDFSTSYSPSVVPQKFDGELLRYLEFELKNIAASIKAVRDGHFEPQAVAPGKPRQGDIRYADGTNWNPGSGSGLYYFNGSSWILFSNMSTVNLPLQTSAPGSPSTGDLAFADGTSWNPGQGRGVYIYDSGWVAISNQQWG